jgi:hypothetical protein
MLAGSTIAIALSLFSSTSNAGDGVCANADAPKASIIIAATQAAQTLTTNFRHRFVAVISRSPSRVPLSATQAKKLRNAKSHALRKPP